VVTARAEFIPDFLKRRTADIVFLRELQPCPAVNRSYSIQVVRLAGAP
jgi:DNA mismatch repair ATPase MutS